MRVVTEQDFRMPEFRDAKPEDYEFRADGKLVRKDRWERGMFTIASILSRSRDFEVSDIINDVDSLITLKDSLTEMIGLEECDPHDLINEIKNRLKNRLK
jgi:hypothetical protein